MNKKTKKDKLKIMKKQCHHVDSNIVISAIDPDDMYRDKCYEILSTLMNGRNRFVGMCKITLGEVHDKITTFNKTRREEAHNYIDENVSQKKIKIYKINSNDIDKYYELRRIEKHCHVPELIALAVAINNKGTVFISNDTDINSDGLKEYLNGTIKLKLIK